MSVGGFLVLFICIWWLLMYMALPIGNKQDFDIDTVGAPKQPRLILKGLIVTGITTTIMLVLHVLHFGDFLNCYIHGDANCTKLLRFGD